MIVNNDGIENFLFSPLKSSIYIFEIREVSSGKFSLFLFYGLSMKFDTCFDVVNLSNHFNLLTRKIYEHFKFLMDSNPSVLSTNN